MGTSSQNVLFWFCDNFFSPSGWLSNQHNFSVAVHVCKIPVFDEVFFLLTIRMRMVNKLFRMVTYREELSPINMNGISTEWSCGVSWQMKFIYPPAEDASTLHQARCWLRVRGSQTWPFDQVTKLKPRDCLYISIFTRFIANKLGRQLTLGRIFSMQTTKSSPLLVKFFIDKILYNS